MLGVSFRLSVLMSFASIMCNGLIVRFSIGYLWVVSPVKEMPEGIGKTKTPEFHEKFVYVSG
jgi:hypothetical protein